MILLAQLPSNLFDLAFTLAVVTAALLLIGGMVSFAVFLYRSIKGEGMKDPEEVVPEKIEDEDGLREGDEDDEWDYY